MKKILLLLGLGILFSTIFTSCEKKDPIDVTKNAYLFERAWKLKDIQFTLNIEDEFPVWVDEFTSMEPCKKDDYLYFHTKNSGAVFDYFIKCAASQPDSINFWFSITENDQMISIYTDPEDIDNSTIMWGQMETPNINEFRILQRVFNDSTETTTQRVYTYEYFKPTDI